MMVMMVMIQKVTAVSGACAHLGSLHPNTQEEKRTHMHGGAQIKKHMAPEVSASL